MNDKIPVTLPELLEIANSEFKQRPAYNSSRTVSSISKGVGTFKLEISDKAAIGSPTIDDEEFAQSLYDRYLLAAVHPG